MLPTFILSIYLYLLLYILYFTGILIALYSTVKDKKYKYNKFNFQDILNYKKCPMLYYYEKSTNYTKKFITIKQWFEQIMRKILFFSLFHNELNYKVLIKKLDNMFKFKEQNILNTYDVDYYQIGKVIIKNYISYMKLLKQSQYEILFKAHRFEIGMRTNTVYTGIFDIVYNYKEFNIPVLVNLDFNESKSITTERLILSAIAYQKIYGNALYKSIDLYSTNNKLNSYHLNASKPNRQIKEKDLEGVINGIYSNIFYTNNDSLCKIECPYYQNCPISKIELEKDMYAI